MNIFKKLYQKYIIGIHYPVDKYACGAEQLKHLCVDELDPYWTVYADMLDKKQEITKVFNIDEINLERIEAAFEHHIHFFEHYIITRLFTNMDENKVEITWAYIN